MEDYARRDSANPLIAPLYRAPAPQQVPFGGPIIRTIIFGGPFWGILELYWDTGRKNGNYHLYTLPETNMETPKGPYKDCSPCKRGLYGFPC